MKIISNFKDYYDHGMVHGIDTAVQYRRFTREESIPSKYKNIVSEILGFCGTFWETKVLKPNLIQNIDEKVFDQNDVNAFIENGWVLGNTVMGTIRKDQPEYSIWLRPIDLQKKNWNDSTFGSWNLKNYTHWKRFLREAFIKYQTPIFYIASDSWGRNPYVEVNPNTQKLGLHKFLNSVEAFQELSMFIPTLRQIDDFHMTNEELGTSKGFDHFSFRHQNTKTKPKKF